MYVNVEANVRFSINATRSWYVSVLQATRVAAEFNQSENIKGLRAPISVIYNIFSPTADFHKNAPAACDICSRATGANLQPLHRGVMGAFQKLGRRYKTRKVRFHGSCVGFAPSRSNQPMSMFVLCVWLIFQTKPLVPNMVNTPFCSLEMSFSCWPLNWRKKFSYEVIFLFVSTDAGWQSMIMVKMSSIFQAVVT